LSDDALPPVRPPRSKFNLVLVLVSLLLLVAIGVTGYLALQESQQQSIPQTMTDVQVQSFQDQLKKTPDDPSLYLGLAASYFAIKQYDDALGALDQMQSINPTGTALASGLYARGRIAERQGNQDSALSYYLKSLDVTETLDARYALGVLYLGRKQYNDAITSLQRYVAAQPDQAAVLRQLAAAFEGAGDTSRALETYQKAYEFDPTPATLADINRLKGQQQ
jgi:tetratricopeptide (TPR) repeat protein